MENRQIYLRTVGDYIQEKRKASGMTQAIVSEQTGISRSSIAKYESGENEMPIATLPALCSLYDCRVADCGLLLDREVCMNKIGELTKKASKSSFINTHYLHFMCGTDTQKQDIATVEEMEFEELVRYTTQYLKHLKTMYGKMDMPTDIERLENNFSLFMLEFIEYNEPRKEVRKRLQECFHKTLAEINGEDI